MKITISFILAIFSFALSATAANTIKFINHCPYDIWYWTVGPAPAACNAAHPTCLQMATALQGLDSERINIPGLGSAIHGLINTELLDAGLSLKIRDVPRYQVAPAGIVQVEYHFEPSRSSVWYDLSVIDCDHTVGPEHSSFCPLVGGGVKLHIPNAEKGWCPPAWCENGECVNTYERHGSWFGEPTLECKPGVDILIETCE